MVGVGVEVAVGMNVGLAVGVGIGVAVGVYVGIVVGTGVFVRVGVDVGRAVGVGVTVGLDGYLGGRRVSNGVDMGVVVSLGVVVVHSGSVAASELIGVRVSNDSAISFAPTACDRRGVSCAGSENEGVGHGVGIFAPVGHVAR